MRRSKEPVNPYSIDIPYSNKPEASAPKTKYFIPLSEDLEEGVFIAASKYSGKDCNSSDKYNTCKYEYI